MNDFFEYDDDMLLGEERGEINLIPLLDTIFILLIFFSLLLIHASQSRVMDIELPRGEGTAARVGSEWQILVDRNGVLMTGNGEVLTEESLKEKLQGNHPDKILLSADGSVAFSRVITLLDLIENEGLATVSIEVTSP